MGPTIILAETHPTNTLSPRTALSGFTLLETIPTPQKKNTTPNDAAAFAWATLAHHQLTMDPTIASLTIKNYIACERPVHI